jgi:hypothetical protein
LINDIIKCYHDKYRVSALALFDVFDVPNDCQPVLEFVQAIFVLGEIARQVRELRVGVVIGDTAAVDPICRRLQHSAGRLGKRPAAKRTFALLVIRPFPDDQGHQIGNIGGGSKGIWRVVYSPPDLTRAWIRSAILAASCLTVFSTVSESAP